MATLLRSRVATATDNAPLEIHYHELERSLQLAYAVGDRDHITALETEVERLTGWRFNRRR